MRSKSIVISGLLLCVIGVVSIGFFFRWGKQVPSERKEASQVDWEKEEASARELLAFQSLEDRIPKGKPTPLRKPFSGAAKERWEQFEQKFDFMYGLRSELLKALHEKTRRFFVESPGFGSGRRIIPSDDKLLLAAWINKPTPDQPGSPAAFPLSLGDSVTAVEPDNEHYGHHLRAINYFAGPWSLGYFKDRHHVAGFQTHGFWQSLPPNFRETSDWRWQIDHILLIGILLQEQPLVYLSDKLPSMEQIRNRQTRELDWFEETALAALKEGEDLYIVQQEETLRMLGALRATKQCLKCHDGERGDLLGAFSYTLRPVVTTPAP